MNKPFNFNIKFSKGAKFFLLFLVLCLGFFGSAFSQTTIGDLIFNDIFFARVYLTIIVFILLNVSIQRIELFQENEHLARALSLALSLIIQYQISDEFYEKILRQGILSVVGLVIVGLLLMLLLFKAFGDEDSAFYVFLKILTVGVFLIVLVYFVSPYLFGKQVISIPGVSLSQSPGKVSKMGMNVLEIIFLVISLIFLIILPTIAIKTDVDSMGSSFLLSILIVLLFFLYYQIKRFLVPTTQITSVAQITFYVVTFIFVLSFIYATGSQIIPFFEILVGFGGKRKDSDKGIMYKLIKRLSGEGPYSLKVGPKNHRPTIQFKIDEEKLKNSKFLILIKPISNPNLNRYVITFSGEDVPVYSNTIKTQKNSLPAYYKGKLFISKGYVKVYLNAFSNSLVENDPNFILIPRVKYEIKLFCYDKSKTDLDALIRNKISESGQNGVHEVKAEPLTEYIVFSKAKENFDNLSQEVSKNKSQGTYISKVFKTSSFFSSKFYFSKIIHDKNNFLNKFNDTCNKASKLFKDSIPNIYTNNRDTIGEAFEKEFINKFILPWTNNKINQNQGNFLFPEVRFEIIDHILTKEEELFSKDDYKSNLILQLCAMKAILEIIEFVLNYKD
ncbi:MAG: hypothetical protein QXD62_03495 [Candidatus Woesearchaeota archaeon]